MHYVQDFVELIEGLPEEIVGKLKKIKELDQDVQNSLRNIRKRENAYFTEASGKTDDTRILESKKISKDYEEVAKIANVKVKLATELENLIARYHKKLDQDLEKFKKELESETPGITEKLERKKHIESDLTVIDDLAGKFLESNSPAGIERREQSRFETVPNLFEATFPYEHDKPLSSLELMDHDGLLSAPQHMEEISIEPRPGQTIEWLPPRIDPNEPTYCTCNQVSYGEMVGCDNQKCPIEWFHYGCVGIKEPPNGNWFCPLCRSMQKKQESDPAD